jgi:pimeloyl-ACP methyl ester carboxylesterase
VGHADGPLPFEGSSTDPMRQMQRHGPRTTARPAASRCDNVIAVSNVFETRLLRTRTAGFPFELAILEKLPVRPDPCLPPMLLLHGATFAARLFDLPRPGYSLMTQLASRGRPVYALDVRGFGSSLGGRAMEEPPDCNPSFAGVDEAIDDVAAAVDLVLAHHRVARLDLVGFSWGAVLAGRFAGFRTDKIMRLGLYAPLYADIHGAWLDRTVTHPTLGAYRMVGLADLVERWDGDLPAGDPRRYREDGIPELLFEAIASLDPRASAQTPPAFRCPNGPLADLCRIRGGQRLFDPGKLTRPTLIMRGADDTTSADTDALRLLGQIASPEKRYCVIAPGSHFLCLEKSRAKLYEQLNVFFAPLEGSAIRDLKLP